jgi:hypothetical protein
MIDSITFPMEMHIVNVLKDSNAQTRNTWLSACFSNGPENKFIEEFLNSTQEEEKISLRRERSILKICSIPSEK